MGTGIAVGAYVGKVKPESLASRMGLVSGDIILEVNTHHITNADDLEGVISSLVRGKSLSILYVRNGREQTVTGRV